MNEIIKITSVNLEGDYNLIKNLFPMIENSFILQLEHIKSLKSIKIPLRDASFTIENANQKVLIAVFLYENALSLANWPIQILSHDGLPIDNELGPAIFKELQKNSLELTFHNWSHIEPISGLYSIEEELLEIDLTQSDEFIAKDTRRSYRSLFNWGKRALDLQILEKDNITEESFSSFSNYYEQISGRSKSSEFWNGLFLMIKNGHGFITLAHMQSKLVATTLVLHGIKKGYYALGAYDKECMEQNIAISHWPMLFSILHAKKIGLLCFELGFIRSDETNPKERGIFKFKKGFTGEIHKRNLYSTKAPVKKSMKIVFRVDSGNHIGIGHLLRCKTLAMKFIEEGHNVTFICKDHIGRNIDLISDIPTKILTGGIQSSLAHSERNDYSKWLGEPFENDLEKTNEIIESIGKIDLVVLDHYSINKDYESKLKASTLMVIDDLNREHDCSYLLDQNSTANLNSYQNKNENKNCYYWLGEQYALIRPEFLNLRHQALEKDLNSHVKSLLIFFGGSDPNSDTLKVVNALNGVSFLKTKVILNSHHNDYKSIEKLIKDFCLPIELLPLMSDISQLILESDLCIGAGGSSVYERSFLGTASYIISVAENQEANAQILADKKMVKYLGISQSLSIQKWKEIINNIPNNLEEISQLRQNCINLTEGKAALMIGQKILKDLIHG